MKSATGGTFAIIHKGHTKLFYECVKRNTNVTVGVTLFPLVEKYHPVPSFEIRSYNVKNSLSLILISNLKFFL
jgi:Predicted nucleotidyltransferase